MEELETKKINQIEFVRQLSFKFLPTFIQTYKLIIDKVRKIQHLSTDKNMQF